MAERMTIARPYATAAFETARDAGTLAQWSEMLKLATSLVADAGMSSAITSPNLEPEAKASLFLSIAGERFSPGMRNFVRILVGADRIEFLPEITERFEVLRNEAEGVAMATIETALPLSDAQVAELAEALGKRFGKKIEASTRLNPALIGGARIFVGDTVIDGSVRGKLDAMQNALRA